MKDLVEEIDKNYRTRSSYEVELDEMGTLKNALGSQIIAYTTSMLYHLDISLLDI